MNPNTFNLLASLIPAVPQDDFQARQLIARTLRAQNLPIGSIATRQAYAEALRARELAQSIPQPSTSTDPTQALAAALPNLAQALDSWASRPSPSPMPIQYAEPDPIAASVTDFLEDIRPTVTALAQHLAETILKPSQTAQPPSPTLNPAPFTVPPLNPGETYAGVVIIDNRPSHHLILLPTAQQNRTAEGARSFARYCSADLPTRQELTLLLANCKEHLPDTHCWTGEEASDDLTWAVYIPNGMQVQLNSSQFRAHVAVVRRVSI